MTAKVLPYDQRCLIHAMALDLIETYQRYTPEFAEPLAERAAEAAASALERVIHETVEENLREMLVQVTEEIRILEEGGRLQ